MVPCELAALEGGGIPHGTECYACCQGGEGGEGRSAASLGAFGGVISLGVIDAMAAVGGIYIGGPRCVLPDTSTALVRMVSSRGLLCRLRTWLVGRVGVSFTAKRFKLERLAVAGSRRCAHRDARGVP